MLSLKKSGFNYRQELASEVGLGAGELDTSFNGTGIVTTDFFGSMDEASAIAIDSNGKILVAGTAKFGAMFDFIDKNDFAIARYNSDGSLDPSFDQDGKVTTDIFNDADFGHAIAIDRNGKILVAGESYNGAHFDFALVRYNTDGSLDQTFGRGGIATTPILNDNTYGLTMTIDSNGKILVAGFTWNGPFSDFAIARYNSNGGLDTTFDNDGKLTTDFFGASDGIAAIKVDKEGKIIVAGDASSAGNSSSDFALARYNNDGTLDTTFDTDGKVTTPVLGRGRASGLAIDDQGKILVTGESSHFGVSSELVLARYNVDGSLDPTFATDGKVTTAIPGWPNNAGRAIALDRNGKIIISGDVSDEGTNYNLALFRYNSNGTPDRTFGQDGSVITPRLVADELGSAIAIDSQGQILVAGPERNKTNHNFLIARYGGGDADVLTPTNLLPPTPLTITMTGPNVNNPDRGQPTNLPANQEVNDYYFLSDNDDSIASIPLGKVILALSGNDQVIGSVNNDHIHGNQGTDILDGSMNNDTLRGGKQNDFLMGGNGNDELWGDRAFDRLIGGEGNDTFCLQYTDTDLAQTDVIVDFTINDKIKLIGTNFGPLSFELVNLILGAGPPLPSTAIKVGNDYLAVVYAVDRSVLTSNIFW